MTIGRGSIIAPAMPGSTRLPMSSGPDWMIIATPRAMKNNPARRRRLVVRSTTAGQQAYRAAIEAN